MQFASERFAYALAWSLPAIVLAIVLATVVNVPVADEWIWAPLIVKMHAGTLTFGDLWVQQGTHRSLVPTALALLLAKLFGWNTRVEAATSVVLAALTQAALFRLIAMTVPQRQRAATFLIASVLLFSLIQYENWTWGFQLSWFLVNLCVVVVVTFSSSRAERSTLSSRAEREARSRGTATHLTAAAIAAIIASYSLIFGFGAWIAGAFLLLARRAWSALALWSAIAIVVVVVFLAGYHAPLDDPGWKITLAHPARILGFVFVYLGAPLALWAGPIASGICGLALIVAWSVISTRRVERAWQALALFVVVAAVLEAVGRAAGGLQSALASHYTTTSTLAWIALLGAVWSQRVIRIALPALSVIGSCVGVGALIVLHGYQQDARDALLVRATNGGAPLQGYPLWSQVRRDDLAALLRLGDGPFRAGAHAPANQAGEEIGTLPPPPEAPWLYDGDPPQIVAVAIAAHRLHSGDATAMRVVTTTNVAAVTVALGPIAANLPRRAAGIFEGRAPIPRYPDIPLLFPRDSDLAIIATNSRGERAFSSIRIRLL